MITQQELALCVICRDDADNVARLVTEARKYVHEIVIVDTGSTDGSPARAREAGADVVTEAAAELNTAGHLRSFGEARQLSYDIAVSPWRLWLDTDDTLNDWTALPEIAMVGNRLRQERGPISVELRYDYSWTPDRSRCMQSFYRERFTHRDDGWSWHRPVHEYLNCKSQVTKVRPPHLWVTHLSQGARGIANDRNLRILREWERTTGPAEDPGTLYYYLGDEMLARDNWAEAVAYFNKVHEGSSFKLQALFRTGRAMINSQMYDEAIKHFNAAILKHGQVAHLHWELSRALWNTGNRSEALHVLAGSEKFEPINSEDPGLFCHLANAMGLQKAA